MAKKKRPLSTKEAAELLSVRRRTVQRWCDQGRLRCSKLPGTKKWLVDPSYIEHATSILRRGEALPVLVEEATTEEATTEEATTEEATTGVKSVVSTTSDLPQDVKTLAKRLQQLTEVPKPDTPFLPETTEAEAEIAEALLEGKTRPLVSAMITGGRTPWWCATGSLQLRRHLIWEQEALLDRFLGLPTSQEVKVLLDEWEEKANDYLRLKQLEGKTEEVDEAYRKADDVSQRLHSELWKAVEALRWGQ